MPRLARARLRRAAGGGGRAPDRPQGQRRFHHRGGRARARPAQGFGAGAVPARPHRRLDRPCPGTGRARGIDPAARPLYGSATRKLRQCPNDRRADHHRHAARRVRRRAAQARCGRPGRPAEQAGRRGTRRRGGAVVFIQHDGPPGDPHHPDLPGWKLLEDLDARPADTVIRKKSCDAFLHTSLEAFLRARADRSADHHRLGDRLLRRHHRAQRPGARLSDDRALRRPHHVEPAPSRRRPRSSSITTPSGPTSWRPADPPWSAPARTAVIHQNAALRAPHQRA